MRITPDDSWVVSETVGNYRIVGSLGVGGMGTVYRAEHVLIGRPAAVKLLHPEMTANRDVVTRFFNEARATSAIKHPGIVEIFDFGYTQDSHAYIVMELLEGETLAQRIRAGGRMPTGDAAVLMRDVCSALAAAHDKGIVHRDLKPDNIFIVPDPEQGERTKILDFGIAKLTEMGLASGATKTGAVMGTPTYMSPEQCRGAGQVDHRADLYSIGCMLYELVAGRPPFVNPGAGELIGSHLFVEPEPLSRHAPVTADLESLVMSLLAKDPAQRVQTARELGQYLVMIAQAHGAHGRMSVRHTSQHASASAHLTPAHYTPAHYTPAHHTPVVPSGPTISEKPTTLSGSASQAASQPGHGRRAGVMIGTALAAIAIGIVVFVAMRGTGSEPTHTPAARPSEPPAATPVADKPVAPPVADPPVVDPPVADKPVVDPPVADKPVVDKPVADKPVADKPVAKPDKPRPKKPKPDVKKPPKPDGDLLETDL